MTTRSQQYRVLIRYMLFSLATALATMGIKVLAALITGSVGFLSDAMESAVNLAAAAVALFALRAAERPPDHNHQFGHGNAEYLSAAVEGAMVFVAAAAIVWTSVRRLLHPVLLDQPALGLALSTGAAALNLFAGLALLRAGRRYRSIVLLADGKHLLTDVWTSAGVVAGVGLVALFRWTLLDPVVALLVGVNILWTGYRLLRRSVVGLLDATLPADDLARIAAVIDRYQSEDAVEFSKVRTRESGRQRFVYATILVPGTFTVEEGHRLCQRFEADIERELPGATMFVHVEPRGDRPVGTLP